jgi:hypothetical protein
MGLHAFERVPRKTSVGAAGSSVKGSARKGGTAQYTSDAMQNKTQI